MTRAALLVALMTSGCSLFVDPDDHLGGGDAGRDADVDARADADSSVDGARDADAGVDGDAALLDGDAAPVDATPDADAMPPPPECSTDAECGTSGVRCVEQRCVFCATPLESPIAVYSEAGMEPTFGMSVGNDGAGLSEIFFAWIANRGATSLVPTTSFYRTSVDSPEVPAGLSNTTSEIEMTSFGDFDRILSFDAAAPTYGTRERTFSIAVLGQRDASPDGMPAASARTFVQSTSDTLVTSGTYPGTDYVDAPGAVLAPLRITSAGFGPNAVFRVRHDDGSIGLEAVEIAYGNTQATWDGPSFPDDPYEPIAAAGEYVAIGTTTDDIALWDMMITEGVMLSAPGRTGAPALVVRSDLAYLLAYGAGSQIHVRLIECSGPVASCAVLEGGLDIETGASAIPRIELAANGDLVAMASYETAGSGTGGRLVLRVIRPDLSGVFDAPGGGDALALESFPAGSARTIPDFHVGVGTPSAGPHYVVGWSRTTAVAGSNVDIRLQSIRATCL